MIYKNYTTSLYVVATISLKITQDITK